MNLPNGTTLAIAANTSTGFRLTLSAADSGYGIKIERFNFTTGKGYRVIHTVEYGTHDAIRSVFQDVTDAMGATLTFWLPMFRDLESARS